MAEKIPCTPPRPNRTCREQQLDSELHQEQSALLLPKRFRPNKLDQARANPVVRKEQDTIETLNRWERDKLGGAGKGKTRPLYFVVEDEYGKRVVAEIEHYVEAHSDTMLKEDWVRKNPIIKGPAQVLYGMLKQGDIKHESATTINTRRGSVEMDASRNLPALQALNLLT